MNIIIVDDDGIIALSLKTILEAGVQYWRLGITENRQSIYMNNIIRIYFLWIFR